jgi:hypothetical protein
MLQPKPHSSPPPSALDAARHRPLFGLIDGVLVDDPVTFAFDGAIPFSQAEAIAAWLRRDIAPELVGPLLKLDAAAARAGFAAALPSLLSRARTAVDAAVPGSDGERRLKAQIGDRDTWLRLPLLLNALRCAPFLDKAGAFGRAMDGIEDDKAAAAALQSMPRHDAGVAALLMMAAVAQTAMPGRLIVAATQIAGGGSEAAMLGAGFAPLVDAVLAHAQNCLPAMQQAGSFADIDLVCRAVERFHRLIRALTAYLDLPRTGRWAPIVAALTKTASSQLEPRLRQLVPDINIAMRRPREAVDRMQLLAALNGTYLLSTVRNCRESLALNEIFDETWSRCGEILSLQLERVMDALRDMPGDERIIARLDAGIKMAEIRFGVEHAGVLNRARDGIERQMSPSA